MNCIHSLFTCCAKCVDEDARLEAEYKRQFPDGPKPILTIDTTKEGALEISKSAIGFEALSKAFGPGGRGMDEVVENCNRLKSEHPEIAS